MDVAELDYALPDALIAQEPLPERDAARLLTVDRASGAVGHRTVRDLPTLLPPRALLVVNDTRVLPARLIGRKPTGGKVELLLVERLSESGRSERWLALGRSSKGFRAGVELELAGGALRAVVGERRDGGEITVELAAREGDVAAALEEAGQVPLPPYIRRSPSADDRRRYQTVFADAPGAVAAPTAGLHLSRPLLSALADAGHELAKVTLHVGPGTFAPVKSERLDDHRMHEERYVVPAAAADAIGEARAAGRPIVAVGTTVVRTLESAARDDGTVRTGAGRTALFIRPGHRFAVVDGLLTNFHLPRSTLLALVMAFAGIDAVRGAYAEAVRERYRFFSYGDAMLLL